MGRHIRGSNAGNSPYQVLNRGISESAAKIDPSERSKKGWECGLLWSVGQQDWNHGLTAVNKAHEYCAYLLLLPRAGTMLPNQHGSGVHFLNGLVQIPH